MMLQMACSNTLIQVMVPDALRGRVMAVYSMMFMGMAPIGALFGGALAERLGAPLTVAIGGLASVAGACWFGLQLPKIRVEARRLIVGPGRGRRRTFGDDGAGSGRLGLQAGVLPSLAVLSCSLPRQLRFLSESSRSNSSHQ